jgi:hypothetical protein
MEVNYKMLMQNRVNYNMLFKKITLWDGGVIIKDLIPQCGGEELKSPHLQAKLPWLFR